MIPDIGVIVAAYVITRMAALILTPSQPIIVRLFAVITVLITIAAGADLLSHGVSAR